MRTPTRLLSVGICLLVTACGGSTEEEIQGTVSFTVEGASGSASIIHTTLASPHNATDRLPYSSPVYAGIGPGRQFFISALRRSGSGNVTVTIRHNGATVRRHTSTSSSTYAEASWTCC